MVVSPSIEKITTGEFLTREDGTALLLGLTTAVIKMHTASAAMAAGDALKAHEVNTAVHHDLEKFLDMVERVGQGKKARGEPDGS